VIKLTASHAPILIILYLTAAIFYAVISMAVELML